MADISKIKLPDGTILNFKDVTSGYITSYTDENMKWTASTSSNTYYPLQSTSTATTGAANTLNSVSFYQYYNTAGGYRRLILGNGTAYTSTGGAYGTVRLYGAPATYYGDLVPGVLSTSSTGRLTANRTWTLPDASGTVALTSDIPSITLNGNSITSPSFYAPTTAGTSGYVLKSNGSGAPTWAAESGGSNVTVTQTLTSGTEIASISVDNVPTKIYAPPDTLSAIAPERIDNTSGITNVTVSGVTVNTSPVVLRSGYTCTLDCEYTLTATLSSETTVATGLPPRIAGGIIDVIQQSTSYARPLRAIVNANGDLKLRYGAAGKYWIHMPYISSVPNSLIDDADNTSY